MELVDVFMKRRSVRKFVDKPVPEHLLKMAIDGARMGCPSAGAIRGWEAHITKNLSFYDAPIYIVICTDIEPYRAKYGTRGTDLYAIQDSAIFCAYIQLVLVDLGLSSCWIGAFRESRVMDAVNTKLRPVAILAVGYEETKNA